MYVERNYLYMNVYPRLQNYCRLHHNLEFQVSSAASTQMSEQTRTLMDIHGLLSSCKND